jgi:hypothetical protein
MRLKQAASLCALILLCLPAAARANAIRSSLAGRGEGSSNSASIVHGVAGNSVDLRDAETGGPFTTEQSSGLLLLIGLGLIAGASLIGGKMGRSDSAEEVENAGETASSRCQPSSSRPRTPTMARISMSSKRGTAAMERMRTQQLRQLSSRGMSDQGQRHNAF